MLDGTAWPRTTQSNRPSAYRRFGNHAVDGADRHCSRSEEANASDKMPRKRLVGYRSDSLDISKKPGIGGRVPAGAVDRKWMKGSPLKGALLALLLGLDHPTYPWHLATLLERRLGPASGIDRYVIYKMLEGLERQGLVARTTRENDSGSWRRQKVYGVTDRTERALSEWIATPVSEEATRTELQVKIAFSRPSDAPVLLRTLDMYERQCMDRLAACEDAEVPMSSWTGLTMNVARTSTEEHLEAELRWIMRTRDWMRDYAVRSGIARR
jgi:DNA-binding PadR family transcriptional regulator